MNLSVIIPVYRTAATLNDCIRSVVRQLKPDDEIILIDDESPDDSGALCDEWAARNSQIHVIHQHHQGLSAARNNGIKASHGTILTFVDSDDTVSPNTYPPLRTWLSNHPQCDMVEYPISIEGGKFRQAQLLTLQENIYRNWHAYWLSTAAYCHTYAWNKLYRRHLFQDIRFPEGRNFEDVDVLPRLLQACTSVATLPYGSYCYHYNPQGISVKATAIDLYHLLESHLRVLTQVHDSAYYAHVLNIALDVFHATGTPPSLPTLPYDNTLKLWINHHIGFHILCQLHRTIHSVRSFLSL